MLTLDGRAMPTPTPTLDDGLEGDIPTSRPAPFEGRWCVSGGTPACLSLTTTVVIETGRSTAWVTVSRVANKTSSVSSATEHSTLLVPVGTATSSRLPTTTVTAAPSNSIQDERHFPTALVIVLASLLALALLVLLFTLFYRRGMCPDKYPDIRTSNCGWWTCGLGRGRGKGEEVKIPPIGGGEEVGLTRWGSKAREERAKQLADFYAPHLRDLVEREAMRDRGEGVRVSVRMRY
ncbi:hypothetical protein EJ06DRAFT_116718 [Trichodelitschia bisporula]|uniref:Uncharacterized protein n=1 Tax=Trichodelitschia bisporula TaxID=703511 RepID=A0A6G1HQF0_9PEZI|nr:hypothetical protein EJ06DRAFT_116718 [Trichodelitschia bisporula]